MPVFPERLQHNWMEQLGAASAGTLPYSAILAHMTLQNRAKAEVLCPGAQGIFVASFPYFSGEIPGNLSLYARGFDYHAVLLARLRVLCGALAEKFPGERFIPLADASPLPEKICAQYAGLGFLGDHTLLISPPYGSYLFLGTILTTMSVTEKPILAGECTHCGACVSACPTGALQRKKGRVLFQRERCLSFISQKKGALMPEEEALFRTGTRIWGCDICQKACPHNQNAVCAPLPELAGLTKKAPYCANVSTETLQTLTDAEFYSRYQNYAFSWRGRGPLLRNALLLPRGAHPKEAMPADPFPS